MHKRQIQANIWLLLVILIWGSTFVLVTHSLASMHELHIGGRDLDAPSNSRTNSVTKTLPLLSIEAKSLYGESLRQGACERACQVIVPFAALIILQQKPAPNALVGVILAGMIVAELKTSGEKIIFTLGTSTRSPEEFLALLKHYRIEKVVDVRRFPTSRFEHFKKEPLAQLLKENGIEFHYLGKELGG